MSKAQGVAATGRAVVRTWQRSGTVAVAAIHPQLGELHRGTVRMAAGAGDVAGRCRWDLTDYDSLPLEAFTGDYLDAEAVLLAATDDLDAPVSAEEAARMLADVAEDDPWLKY